MITSVTLYYNTGLSVGNVLDSSALLSGSTSRAFPNIAVKQDVGLTEIRIDTTWGSVKGADYCKIGNNCYWVTNITMINDNMAVVSLLFDVYTTIGTAGFTIVSGWCTRRHVTDDSYFKYNLPEPFAPSEPLKVEFHILKPSTGVKGDISVILSTVDLGSDYFKKDAIEGLAFSAALESATLNGVFPKIPPITKETTFEINGLGSSTVVPGAGAYVYRNTSGAYQQNIVEALQYVNSFGINSSIIASYVIPREWLSNATWETQSNKIAKITGVNQSVTTGLNPIYATVTNKKALGLFQKYVLMSPFSGDSQEFSVEDIVNNNTVTWQASADPMPGGFPTMRPRYYHGADNENSFVGSVNGATWNNQSFVNLDRSGIGRDKILAVSEGAHGVVNDLYGGVKNFANNGNYTAEGAVKAGVGALLNAGGTVLSTAQNIDALKLQNDFVAPSIQFPIAKGLQNYLGNYFVEFQTRLSDNDTRRFDNFLTNYGYAVSEPLTAACLKGHARFNFVQANDVNLKCSAPLYLKNMLIDVFNSGIRIWHEVPNNVD